jgi:transposase
MTPHSIVRSLLFLGLRSDRDVERSCANVTTIGAEKPNTEVAVILGVDTHLDFHVAVAVDHLGRRLGESSVPTTVKGYESLLNWAEDFGPVRCAGVEGTSSYGAGLVRHLRARGIEVLEVERPERRRRSSRRNLEKSDPSDAERAARAVLAGETSGVPKSGDGRVEMIRALRAARRSAMKARTQAANQLQGLRVTAPEELRHRLRGLSTKELVSVAARFRLGDDPRDVPTATKFALRSVARRYEALSAEIAELDAHLDRLVAQAAPELVSYAGHRYRRRRDALDRGRRQPPEVEERGLLRQSVRGRSNRSLLWQGRTASSQPRWQPGGQPCAVHDLLGSDETRSSHAGIRRSRRTAQGKSKREIIRCLKL